MLRNMHAKSAFNLQQSEKCNHVLSLDTIPKYHKAQQDSKVCVCGWCAGTMSEMLSNLRGNASCHRLFLFHLQEVFE